MFPHKLNTLTPQLRDVLDNLQKHLGNTYKVIKIIRKKISSLLGSCLICDLNGGPAQESLTHMYVNFIQNTLLPQLESLSEKNSIWWSFKPDSLLKYYLEDQQKITLNKYFQPEELKEKVLATLTNELQFTNQDIIMLNEEQQKVFGTCFIFVPDIIKEHLLSHVTTASAEIADTLQNQEMQNQFYIDSPQYDIIYKDPSSVFWTLPDIDFAMNGSTGNFYSWNILLSMFTDLCLNNHEFFTRQSDNIVSVNENTSLTPLFQFKYFHVSQIETILKQLTKLLGRNEGLTKCCPFIKRDYSLLNQIKSCKHNSVFKFVDDVINTNNNLMPYLPIPIYI